MWKISQNVIADAFKMPSVLHLTVTKRKANEKKGIFKAKFKQQKPFNNIKDIVDILRNFTNSTTSIEFS